MSRLFHPATAGVASPLTCGILGSANTAFDDKSAAVTEDDKSA
jgi:hypothetical protein